MQICENIIMFRVLMNLQMQVVDARNFQKTGDKIFYVNSQGVARARNQAHVVSTYLENKESERKFVISVSSRSYLQTAPSSIL